MEYTFANGRCLGKKGSMPGVISADARARMAEGIIGAGYRPVFGAGLRLCLSL
jgi:hypothetical protein